MSLLCNMESIYVYRAWPSINHPACLLEEGQIKCLPFVEERRLRVLTKPPVMVHDERRQES